MKKNLFSILLLVFISFSAQAQWVQISSISDPDIQTVITGVSPLAFAGSATGGLWRSTDSGKNWVNHQSGLTDKNVKAIEYITQSIYVGTPSGVFISTNSGTSFTLANTSLGNTQVNSLAMTGNTVYAGTQDGVYLTYTNGFPWKERNSGIPANPGPINSFMISGLTMYACTANHGLFVSSTNGGSWVSINNGITDKNVTSVVKSGDYLFASTLTKGIFVSDSKGATWIPSNTGLPANLNVKDLHVVNNYLFAVADNSVYASDDDGASWHSFNEGLNHFDVRNISDNGYDLFISNYGGKVWTRPITEGLTIGVNEYALNKNISVYPNPCKSLITIAVDNSQGLKKTLMIYNLQGQLIRSETFNSGTHEVDLRSAKGGMYLYHIEKSGVEIGNGKLVVE